MHSFTGRNPGVFGLAFGAQVLGYLGYLKQAVTKIEQALMLAQNLAHPFSLALAWHCAAEVHRQRGDAQASLECADRELELAREQGFPLWVAIAQIYRGWALARLGHHEEALATIPKGIANYRATGAEMAVPRFQILLADAYGLAGRASEGLRVSAEALAIMQRNRDCDSEAPELYRIRGELPPGRFDFAS
jgi:tetratricopeptide (TPR) repeat protein